MNEGKREYPFGKNTTIYLTSFHLVKNIYDDASGRLSFHCLSICHLMALFGFLELVSYLGTIIVQIMAYTDKRSDR